MQVNSNSIFYIFCPANFATGGPEALHQLGHRLNSLGFNVFMHYILKTDQDPVHPNYLKYNLPYTDEIVNSKKNIIILPETYLAPIFKAKYNAIKKIVWWLSVTNYQITFNQEKEKVKHKKFYGIKSYLNPKKYAPLPTISALKRKRVLNLAHSHFSMDFLKANKLEIIGKISDYMSDSFYEKIANHIKKENFVLYNPKKNGEYLERVKALCPNLSWKALINMSPDEVAHWMNRSKLYVDFGYHPGQERMPREAILMSCCVITGSQGSAAFQDDVPLPEGFKFDETKDSPEAVVKRILLCLDNFEANIRLFASYRTKIMDEKENFYSAVKNLFNKN
ncbi:hypothetical protein [uncultured Pedobacter sp.]|uniref:hypothetical protein n=1 Tax=uncultured Pedobacter sp. TaxID=246139 RepID=UPI0025F11E58|nr:hypothetical protein [uncultured Pedobacter sp.]